jgi:hypothetical protein
MFYIEFMNKDKAFKKERVTFNTYQLAVQWGVENLDNFHFDMIRNVPNL